MSKLRIITMKNRTDFLISYPNTESMLMMIEVSIFCHIIIINCYHMNFLKQPINNFF